jgi:phosphohistidine phosphatase
MLNWCAEEIDCVGPMLRLMLLRHAKSDWSRPGLPDRERPLNARGREAAPMIATHIATYDLVPQRAIVSSAVRTRETWKLMTPSFRRRPETIFERRIYEASPHTILSVIKETPVSIKSLMVVGHNPGLHTLAMALIGSGDGALRTELNAKFPTGALAVIDFIAESWSALRAGTGALAHFVKPRSLSGEED